MIDLAASYGQLGSTTRIHLHLRLSAGPPAVLYKDTPALHSSTKLARNHQKSLTFFSPTDRYIIEMKPQGPQAEPATGFPVGASPVVGGRQPGATGVWSSGLFDCFDDCGLCCITCCCPCITFGKVAEIVDRGSTSCGTAGALYVLLAALTGCQWIYSCTYRTKMRAQYALPDAPCCDCCVHFCCEPCALIQQYKELKARGYDPEIGWHLNAERGNGNAAAPGSAPGMQQMGR